MAPAGAGRGRAAPAAADITGVIGASSTGKGLYAKQRLRAPQRRPGLALVWSPMEETDRYAAFLDAPGVTTTTGLIEAVRAGAPRVVYVADLDRPRARLVDEFTLFCQLAYRRAARVLVEELSYVTLASWAPPAWSKLSTAGSHHRVIELIGTAQRPTMIDKNFLGGCSEVRCYRLAWEDDAVRMRKLLRGPTAEQLMDLPNRHFFHRYIHQARTVEGVQAVPR